GVAADGGGGEAGNPLRAVARLDREGDGLVSRRVALGREGRLGAGMVEGGDLGLEPGEVGVAADRRRRRVHHGLAVEVPLAVVADVDGAVDRELRVLPGTLDLEGLEAGDLVGRLLDGDLRLRVE